MDNESVGQISLDLVTNTQQFKRQMSGIESLAKKTGKALAVAFGAHKVVQFGKECLELGSDLKEVQNVVDVTFPNMASKINEFSKNAATSFGLSETMAKKFSGTMGTMAKSFGFTEEQAYEMGTTLTGLAGDVASFYNMTQDEAFTKLKAVFSGETESLKDLGVVMTQSALDAYALANGFGKTTSAMDEAEKVALRYQFVQEKLSAAQSDFARTSQSWANQTKVLSLRFDSLKASIGQGLIAAFTPVLRVINVLLEKVQGLADSFKTMMEGIFGTESDAGAAFATASKEAAIAAAESEECTGATATNLKKASKYLAGFDVVEKIADSTSTSGGDKTSTNIVSSNSGPSSGSLGSQGAQATGVMAEFKKLTNYLQAAFLPTYQKVCSNLEKPFVKLKNTLGNVFSDVETLGEPLLNYLNGDFLTNLSVTIVTLSEIAGGLLDSFSMVFGDVWNLAAFPMLQNFITVGLPIFTQFCTECTKTLGVLFEEVKGIFDSVWIDAGRPLLEFIKTLFVDFSNILSEFWSEWGEPIFNNLRTAISKTGEILKTLWDEILKPVFDEWMGLINKLWKDHLKPLVENFMSLVGELTNGALEIYNSFIAPIVKYLVEILAPIFKSVFGSIGRIISVCIEGIVDAVNGIITMLKGVVQFVSGVFTGNWKKAWTGVKNIFKGIFDSLVGVIKVPLNLIIEAINSMISALVAGVNVAIRALNKLSFDVPSWIPGIGGKKFGFDIKEMTAPKIPKLAQGGYVKKNTPQLAMIGDNRHQGEVVAPEGKLTEMAMAAVKAAAGPNYSLEILKVLKEILAILKELDLDIVVDGKRLKDVIVQKINQHTQQTGVCEIIF